MKRVIDHLYYEVLALEPRLEWRRPWDTSPGEGFGEAMAQGFTLTRFNF